MKIRLNHTSNHPKCRGSNGDVIDVTNALGVLMIERGGATLVEDEPQPADVTSSTEPEPESTEDEPEPEPAADEATEEVAEESTTSTRRKRG